MSAGVCIGCAELVEGTPGCPRCGKRVVRGRKEILAWESARQHARIEGWMRDGVIDEEIANRLRARVAVSADEDEDAKGRATAVERGADVVVGGVGDFYAEMATRWKRLAKAVDEDAPKEASDAHDAQSLQHDDRTLEAGRAIFAHDGRGAVVGAGIEALAALDDDENAHGAPADAANALNEASKPFGALQVFWFIGTLLVLAGSVMGVREAWRTLEGVWRPVVIAGAFFAYHVLFVGLARLLVRRSTVTGRVLAGIAAGLLPVVFVAAAVSIGQQSSIGVPFAAMLLLASSFTLVLVGRIADRAATGMALAAGLVPSLLLELALGTGGASPSRRAVVVLIALLPVAVAATRARVSASTSTLVSLAAAAYGAIAVGILGLYGGPGDPSLPFDDGGIGQRALMAWLAAAAAIGWWASSGPGIAARFTRVASVPLVVSLAVLVSTSAAALLLGLTQSAGVTPAGITQLAAIGVAVHVPLAVLVLTTIVLGVEQRKRPGALHVAVLVSLGMMVLVGKAVVPDRPELWPSTCAMVPASFLFFGAFVSDRRRRVILATWGVIAAIATLLTVLAVEAVTRTSADDGTPWKTSALTAAVLALSAHVGARTSRPSLHLAGAMFAFVAMATWLLPTATPLLGGTAIGDPWAHTLMLGCAGLATTYGLAALGYATIAPKDDDRRPLDDASLLLATGAVWLGVLFATRAPPFALQEAATVSDGLASAAPVAIVGLSLRVWLAAPSLALAVVLLVRSVRDRSALVTAQAAVALALAAHVFTGAAGTPHLVWLSGLLAASFAVVAAARVPRAEGTPAFARALYGLVPLPFAGGPRTVLDGFAFVALGLAA
ncbi:MAG: putative integral rane protein, partial [Myxococcaceae bacterium]|nr:putative integral rane protein [Myxococcaceae bacterium]